MNLGRASASKERQNQTSYTLLMEIYTPPVKYTCQSATSTPHQALHSSSLEEVKGTENLFNKAAKPQVAENTDREKLQERCLVLQQRSCIYKRREYRAGRMQIKRDLKYINQF